MKNHRLCRWVSFFVLLAKNTRRIPVAARFSAVRFASFKGNTRQNLLALFVSCFWERGPSPLLRLFFAATGTDCACHSVLSERGPSSPEKGHSGNPSLQAFILSQLFSDCPGACGKHSSTGIKIDAAREQFQFETLCVSNHTSCRFAEKMRFFRSLRAGRRCAAASRFTFLKVETLYLF